MKEIGKAIAVAALWAFCSPLFAQASNAAVAGGPLSWPDYQCHAPREGKGLRMPDKMIRRFDATETMPDLEAVAVLEELLDRLSSVSIGNVQIPYALAWRYQKLGRPQDLRRVARRGLESPYLVGNVGDRLRLLLAQSYADEADWKTVTALLQPMTDAECRPIPDAARKLLAIASIRGERYPAALIQLDRICMVDEPEELHWMRSALEIDCRLNGSEACVRRILDYAAEPAPSTELSQMLDAALSQLQTVADARRYLDEARNLGRLSADYRIIATDMPQIEEMVPVDRVVPEYPAAAAFARQSGFVVLKLRVAADGSVLEALPMDAAPPGVFEAASIKAAMKSTFKPRFVNGQPQITEGQYTINYRMVASREQAAESASQDAATASAPDERPSAPRCR